MNQTTTLTSLPDTSYCFQFDCGATTTCVNKSPATYTVSKVIKDATKIALLSAATLSAMPEITPATPSQIDLYSHIFEKNDEITITSILPFGYDVINTAEVVKYLLKHREIKDFLESGLNTFLEITGSNDFSLEYEGMEDEDWESLYVIIQVDDPDVERINEIENRLFNEWLDEVPESIIQYITISIS